MKLNVIFIGFCAILATVGCTKIDTTYKNAKAPEINFAGSAYEYLQSKQGVFDSLLKAVARIPGLVDSLKSKEITLFAPNNRSFELALFNINQARKDSFPKMASINISTIDLDVLDSTLCKYIVRSKIKSTDLYNTLSDGRDVETLKYGYLMNVKLLFTNANGYVSGGPTLLNYSDRNTSIFTRYWVTTQTSTIDITANNAVINLLTSGHDFGFGSTLIRAANKR